MLMGKSSVFKHPGVKAFFLYFVASQINDPLSVNFGGVPVTPLQIAILAGVAMNIKYWSPFVYKKLSLFYLFLLVIVFYTLVKLLSEGEMNLYFLTFTFNLLWVTTVSSSIVKIPIRKADYILILQRLILLLIPSVLFGMYELVTNKYAFPEGLGGAMKQGIDEGNFYVRGGFRDKFDFSSFIVLAPIIYLSCYFNDIKFSLLYKLIAFISVILLLSSYSSSVIIAFGVVVIYCFVFIANLRKSLGLVAFAVILIIGSLTYITQSNIYKTQMNAYNLKYQRQVEDKDESSFRWVAFNVGMEHFLDRPFLGFGLDNSKKVIFKYAPTISPKPTNSHNYFVNNLVDFGLLGFSILTGALVSLFLFYRKIRKWRSLIKPMADLVTLLLIFNVITFQTYYHTFDRSMYFILIFLIFLYFSLKLNDESAGMRTQDLSGGRRNPGVEVGSGA
ncbi:MAG: hypothetical protein C0154_02815 [Mucilaginibacter sp.]|nr:MAG: hypothetical protein BGO48_13330 [Mucilaginibacter sp. 44-25]PLW91124.1 MAG: hypothetical protein C0154_02815 [Mucilaginibacter sp.]PMP64799.1 MAG: hypothetical protein C0191_05370 [Mucilaginibacter sp.]HEK19631.1 O-antigen ligase domain-containing protein [Bacteroidota bacterium]